MRSLKPAFGVISTVVPIVYCGGLVYYFYNYAGSIKEAETIGLAPTLLGLSAVGVLFCIPLIVKIYLVIVALRSPGSGGRGGPDGPNHDGEAEIDADAMIARYMAQRSAEGGPTSPTAPNAHNGDGPARRSSFGRKIR